MKYCSNVSIAIQVEKAQESAEETVTYQHFKLTVMQGEFTDSQIVVIAWGEGNREFINMLVHSTSHLSLPFHWQVIKSFGINTKKCKYITNGNCVLMFGIIYHDEPCQDFNNYRLLEIYYVFSATSTNYSRVSYSFLNSGSTYCIPVLW
jgi:hypothetical protein